MLSSIKNAVSGAVDGVKAKVANAAIKNMDFNDPKVKAMLDEQLAKMGVPPQYKQMFQKLIQNAPELLMKIAQETEETMKAGKSQIAAAQSVMMKYRKELQDAMK